MVTPQVLDGPRLKVKRANGHIDEFRQLTEPLHPSLYEVRLHESRGSVIELDPAGFQLMYRPKQPIPQLLALVIGDAVHNLRGALDHLCTGVVRTVDKGAKRYFPMQKNRENLVSPSGEAAKTLTAIEEALPGARKRLLEEIRPHNSPAEDLWGFHALDNDDKHNLLIPVVTLAEVSATRIDTAAGSMEGITVRNDAAGPIGLILSSSPITIHGDIQTTVEVRFPEGGLFENEPVLPTLIRIRDMVSETISAFERLIRNHSRQAADFT